MEFALLKKQILQFAQGPLGSMGSILPFVADHVEKIRAVIFQPVIFYGRDEDISSDQRYARQYPVLQIAYNLQAQTSIGWAPMRDWFPASGYAVFANLSDVLHPEAALGSLFPDIHPNQAISPRFSSTPARGKLSPSQSSSTWSNSCVMSLTSEGQQSTSGGHELAATSTARWVLD